MLLENKSVAVTGGSRGIGRAVALACARAGADVAVNFRPEGGSHGPGVEVVEQIRGIGRRAIAVEGDVADPHTAQMIVAQAVEAFGKLDVLASNAGICPFHAFLDMPLDLMRQTMEVNLFGTFYVAQAAANQMVRQGHGGSIIAMSSISALVGGEMQTHYTPTKAGIHSLMQSCAIALGPYGIRCNSVLPGTIETDINRGGFRLFRKSGPISISGFAWPSRRAGRPRWPCRFPGLQYGALCHRRGPAGRRRAVREPAIRRTGTAVTTDGEGASLRVELLSDDASEHGLPRSRPEQIKRGEEK